jgi:chromosome partitioning protein
MKTLSIYSNKGGVGKTAAAVNLSYMSAKDNLRTLIIDFDPQSSATFYFRVKPKLKTGVKKYAKGKKDIADDIKGTDFENLDILPADFAQRNLDIVFDKFKHSKKRLEKILERFENEYDLLFLDCPPTINILAENIFNASDYLIMPVIPSTLSFRAQEQLFKFFRKKRYSMNKSLLFFSMVDKRKKMHQEHMTLISSKFANVLEPYIPYSSTVEKMGIMREPVLSFSPRSKAGLAYKELWSSLRSKIGL